MNTEVDQSLSNSSAATPPLQTYSQKKTGNRLWLIPNQVA
jgi:hypothetical protein